MSSLKSLFGMTELPYGMTEYTFGRWMVVLMFLKNVSHREAARTFRVTPEFITAIANQDVVPSAAFIDEIVEYYARPYWEMEEAETKRCMRCGASLQKEAVQ
jgi:hypothetical protein